jgi:hypothetical protein
MDEIKLTKKGRPILGMKAIGEWFARGSRKVELSEWKALDKEERSEIIELASDAIHEERSA